MATKSNTLICQRIIKRDPKKQVRRTRGYKSTWEQWSLLANERNGSWVWSTNARAHRDAQAHEIHYTGLDHKI